MKIRLAGGLLILAGLAFFIIGLAVFEEVRAISYALASLGVTLLCIGSGMQVVRTRED